MKILSKTDVIYLKRKLRTCRIQIQVEIVWFFGKKQKGDAQVKIAGQIFEGLLRFWFKIAVFGPRKLIFGIQASFYPMRRYTNSYLKILMLKRVVSCLNMKPNKLKTIILKESSSIYDGPKWASCAHVTSQGCGQ